MESEKKIYIIPRIFKGIMYSSIWDQLRSGLTF